MRAWIGNGERGDLVGIAEAQVSIFDHGFTVGDGVFETVKVTSSGPFALTRHVNRLLASARRIGLPEPDITHVRDVCDHVVAANLSEIDQLARMRITWTPGTAPLGSDRAHVDPTLVVAMVRQTPWQDTTTAISIPWVRNPRSIIAGAKSTSYGENVVALARAHEAGASEALLGTTDGRLCEGTGSNVFVVLDDGIHTPTLESGCLAGITRQLVIEWFGAVESDLALEVLQEADEVFITSSTRDLHPVTRVDEREWTRAGARSTHLRKEFLARARTDLDP